MRRVSAYHDKIKNTEDLLRNIEVRNRCLYDVIGMDTIPLEGASIERGNIYKTSTDEKNDEFALLLDELGLIQIDWQGLKEQKAHKDIGQRTIEFEFKGDDILDIVERAEGKKSIIDIRTLEQLARHLGELCTGKQLQIYLTQWGVPQGLIVYPNTKWRMVYDVLLYYATAPGSAISAINPSPEHRMLFKIFEEAGHPLMYDGDETLAKEFEKKFNNLLKYDHLVLHNGEMKMLGSEDDDEENVFDYDGGPTTPYENSDLELFIMKKILLEHSRRDDSGFFAKEFSFEENSLTEICKIINRLMEDRILYLSANTRPESLDGEEGIESKNGFINWELVEKLDKKTETMDLEDGAVIFDLEIIDEVKLRGKIDIAIDHFMNDKIYTPLGLMMDLEEVQSMSETIGSETGPKKRTAYKDALTPKRVTDSYSRQRDIVINELAARNEEEILLSLRDYPHKKVDLLKTLLALEKENIIRIRELKSNQLYDEGEGFIGAWSEKDNPVARIVKLKSLANNQQPIPIVIKEMPPISLAKKQSASNRKNKKIIKLYLNDAGDLWQEPKDKFCYKMGRDCQPHRLIKQLASRKEFIKTSYLTLAIGSKSDKNTRSVIGKVNRKIKGDLKITEPDVINSKPGCGYKINEKYDITLVDPK